jgi:retinol dehydrogenase-12
MMSEQPLPGEGKICVVTGASRGIGFEIARALANQGARVLLVGRDRQRCNLAVDRILRENGNASVDYILADLSSQKEVREVASLLRQYARLDVLINNVGASFPLRRESADGVEMTFALNHLSHFLLTNLLIETLRASDQARVVNVSSFLHARGQMNFEDLEYRRGYNGLQAYAQAKLANMLFTYELARRLDGTGITVNALNPGFVATYFALDHHGFISVVRRLFTTHAITPVEAARSGVHLALSPELEKVSGSYFDGMSAVDSSSQSYDLASAQRLWQISSEMVRLPVKV